MEFNGILVVSYIIATILFILALRSSNRRVLRVWLSWGVLDACRLAIAPALSTRFSRRITEPCRASIRILWVIKFNSDRH